MQSKLWVTAIYRGKAVPSLKVNAAGVMPIIFAQAIMFANFILFTSLESGQGIARIFSDYSNGWYMLIYGIMVIAFTICTQL